MHVVSVVERQRSHREKLIVVPANLKLTERGQSLGEVVAQSRIHRGVVWRFNALSITWSGEALTKRDHSMMILAQMMILKENRALYQHPRSELVNQFYEGKTKSICSHL